MILLQFLLILTIIAMAWPIGLLIAKQTKEELKTGKKWFSLVCIISMIIMILGLFAFSGDDLILVESTLDFIFLLSLASIYEANKIGGKR
jgi:hypothetical protein